MTYPRVVGLLNDEGEDTNRRKEIAGVVVEARDPHGFWWVVDPKHPELQGAFTSFQAIEQAVQRLEARKRQDKVRAGQARHTKQDQEGTRV